MHTLLTWLGTQDINSMMNNDSAAIATIATKSEIPFDKIVILANHLEEKWGAFEAFLAKRLSILGRPSHSIKVQKAHIISPIDYQSIAIESEKWINQLSREAGKLAINLTSGTPAMTAISVIIGKGKSNTYFLQTSPNNELISTDIPIDFAQTYSSSATKNFAHTVSTFPKIDKAFSELTAHSSVMKRLIEKAKRISNSPVSALILGETGTGKELMATAIHQGSAQSSKPLRVINCGALSENLVDSTLFGHKKGAFTGADKDHPGLFEQADGGTLFLDEVGELTPAIQVKLLRALQQGEINRLGDIKTINVDVRIIAATHQDLVQLVAEGKFREDLFYRLAVGIIEMPPLRERTEDIPLLVDELTAQINKTGSKCSGYISKNISEKGKEFILSQAWAGNIRELWSTINRAFLWSDSQTVTEKDLQSAIIKRSNKVKEQVINLTFNDRVDIAQLTDEYQKKYVLAALHASGNVKKQATKILGLKDHQTLTNWMKRLDIPSEK